MLHIDFANLRDKGLLKAMIEDFVSTCKKSGYPTAKNQLRIVAIRHAEKQISGRLTRHEKNVLFIAIPFPSNSSLIYFLLFSVLAMTIVHTVPTLVGGGCTRCVQST